MRYALILASLFLFFLERLDLGRHSLCEIVGDRERQSVLQDLPRSAFQDENSRSATRAVALAVEKLVEPGDAVARDIGDDDVSRPRLVCPARSFRKVRFGESAEFLDGPAFGSIGADVDGIICEQLEVATAVSLRCRSVKLIESGVDRSD